MRMRFFLGFLAGLAPSLLLSPLLYQAALQFVPGPWGWLVGIPILGYWVGQRPRSAFWCGVVWGWITPALLLLPDLEFVARRMAWNGGCGTARRWAWVEATALLFCIPAALGQLRCLLRRRVQSRLPE